MLLLVATHSWKISSKSSKLSGMMVLHNEMNPPRQIKDPSKPKLAFLFLTRHVMPLDILWIQHFFEGSRENEIKICLHDRPESYTDEYTKCRLFLANRQLKNSIQKNGTKKPHNCMLSEHFIQTLFAMEDNSEVETERRTLKSYSRWENHVKGVTGREGWHPALTFTFHNSILETYTRSIIQASRSIRYQTESPKESRCKVAGKSCFLFARKVTRAVGFRLLDQVSRYEKRASAEATRL